MSFKLNSTFGFLLAALAVIALALVCHTVWWETQHHFASPIYDDIFDRLRFYKAKSQIRTLLAYLIVPHNEHRIATTRLVEIADEVWFSGRELLQVVLTNVLQVAAALGSFLLFRRWVGRDWSFTENAFVAALLLVLFVNADLLYTLIVPFQIQHTLMAVLCLGASALIALASEPSDCATPTVKLFVPLLLLAVVATFTIGNAPVILLAAAALAVVLRWRLKIVAALAAMAVFHTGLMLLITPQTGTRSLQPLLNLKFLVLYLGGVFFRVDPWPAPYAAYVPHPYWAAAFGIIILTAAIAFALWRFLKPGAGGPLAAYGLSILVMVIVTGLAAALSRSQFGVIEAVNKKYASFAALAWLGLLATSMGFARDRLARHAMAPLVPAMMFAVVVLPLCALAAERETGIWQKAIDKNWEAASAIFAGVGAKDRVHDLYSDDAQLKEYIDDIEPRRRGIFAQFPFAWGDDVAALLASRHEVGCRSEVEAVSPIRQDDLVALLTGPGQAASISGWTWMASDQAPPRLIIAVDGRQRIVGAAFVTRLGGRSEEWLGQKMGRDVGWFGYVRHLDDSPLTFIALARQGGAYCRLGQVGDTR